MASKFEIRRQYAGSHISRMFTGVVDRGLALGPDDSDPTVAVVATGTKFLGFLTRPVTALGSTLEDAVYPGRLEGPFKSGGEVTLEKADEVEVEGELANAGLLNTSGTGAITALTSIGTGLSFYNGKLRQAQGGEEVFYRLSGVLTPLEDVTNIRILAEIVR